MESILSLGIPLRYPPRKLDRSRRSLFISKTDEPLLGMLDRIREQIRKDLCQAVLISLHHQGLAAVWAATLCPTAYATRSCYKSLSSATNIQLLANQRHGIWLDLGKIEHIPDQPLQQLIITLDDIWELKPCLPVFLIHQYLRETYILANRKGVRISWFMFAKNADFRRSGFPPFP